ncbi:MAG: hypothetical protein C0490_10970 [Marivirga sp.]|nr:hypothetical protein [Marivirga sp.]
MTNDFENALVWFSSAPSKWIESGRKNLEAAGQWVWEVIQGDFNENASTAQVATGTVISMIPFVDQICDVRDLVANCKKINDEPNTSWHWISLVLTLIGLFPALGSLCKGCLKVMFSALRKGGAVSGITPRLDDYVDASVAQLNKFLARPEVEKALVALKWDNPYRVLAKEIKKAAEKINVKALRSAMNEAVDAAQSLLNLVQRWGGTGISQKAQELLKTIDVVRRNADGPLAEAIKPVQKYLQCLARRLEIDADMAHRAHLNAINPHAFRKVSAAEEIAAFKKAKPDWVDDIGILRYEPLSHPPAAQANWPSVRAFDTFHTMKAKTIAPGEKIYRIVDPTSKDNSICWMREEEFKKLKSKSEWRRKFAVWANWNANGEYVTYTVPNVPIEGLRVWEGVTASQRLERSDYVAEGGGLQLVIEPSHLKRDLIEKRKRTGWSYDELGTENDLIGVPVLKNNLG